MPFALIAQLGGDSVVTGFWDYRYGISQSGGVVDSWADVRASGGAGALVGTLTQRPTVSGDGTLAFDGTANLLRTTTGLGGITASCWCVLVVRGTNTVARREYELSVGTATAIISGAFPSAIVWRITAASSADAVSSAAITTAPRVLHNRKTSATDVAARIGSGAEVTTALVTGALTATQFTVGASRSDTLFSNMQGLRAVILGAGVYTQAQVDAINAWAVIDHGAVLTN